MTAPEMDVDERHQLQVWGVVGGVTAALFAIWLVVLPDTVATRFAWDVHPRAAQLFVAAGYVFRAAFFFSVVFESRWRRVRWIFWGNLVFSGTLLVATYLSAEQFNWLQFVPPTAHLWILLYIYEPVALIYLVARRGRWSDSSADRGDQQILPALRIFLVVASGLFLMFGLFLLLNPALAATRWPWELNPLDARIMSAWFLGWAVWSGTLALAHAWDEARLGVGLMILQGLVTIVFMAGEVPEFQFTGRTTALALVIGAVGITVIALGLFIFQERRVAAARGRPSSADAAVIPPGDGT